MNLQATKAKKKLQEIAQKTAKDVGYELGEIPKRSPGQVTGKDDNLGQYKDGGDPTTQSPIVEAMQQQTETQEVDIEKKKQRKFIKDKSRVDEEIEKYRRKREELEQQWQQMNQGSEEEAINLEPGQPFEVPSSKPARGKMHPGKQKSPEKRLGKK